jgi:hypothetical protein
MGRRRSSSLFYFARPLTELRNGAFPFCTEQDDTLLLLHTSSVPDLNLDWILWLVRVQ